MTQRTCTARSDLWHGVEQAFRVWVACMQEQLLCRATLDDLALLHDGDFIAQVVDHGQIMADEQVGHAKALLQIEHQIEHLGLNGHVQRTHGLIGHDELGARNQRTCNRNALALAA